VSASGFGGARVCVFCCLFLACRFVKMSKQGVPAAIVNKKSSGVSVDEFSAKFVRLGPGGKVEVRVDLWAERMTR
jgi:hypothetical protein